MASSADALSARESVYRQMMKKFPAAAIRWVRTIRWSGPADVPCDQINSSGKASWQASHEPQKVRDDRAKNRQGRGRPIVLVRTPDGVLNIVDGHHRYLAAAADKRPVTAWIGSVPAAVGPWSETHSSQNGGQ